ncbi:MAG: hypothetical protein ACYC66_15990 [Chloroflexota bacterium]
MQPGTDDSSSSPEINVPATEEQSSQGRGSVPEARSASEMRPEPWSANLLHWLPLVLLAALLALTTNLYAVPQRSTSAQTQPGEGQQQPTATRAAPSPTAASQPATTTSQPAATLSASPAAAAATPEPTGAAPTATAKPASTSVVVTNTDGQGVFLRSVASSEGRILKVWPEKTIMTVIGEDKDAEGLKWRNVRDPDGNGGWVAAKFLTPRQ